MYIPKSFNEDRLEVLHGFIRTNPLGLLISNGDDGPLATSIPFYLVEDGSPFGTLQAHLARANPHWKSIDGQKILVVFQGPDAYVSPSWYPSKDEHGMVVPTWNYAMVQARGTVRVIDDGVWLKQQIAALTNQQEAPREQPWKVSDAPDEYINSQIRAIIGLDLRLSSLEGKWKVSQNRSSEDRQGVIDNLRAEGNSVMSELVRERGEQN